MSKVEDDTKDQPKEPPPAYDAPAEQTALRFVNVYSSPPCNFEVSSLTFSPLGDVLAATMSNRLQPQALNEVRLWHPHTFGEITMKMPHAARGSSGVAFAPQPDLAFATGYSWLGEASGSRSEIVPHARMDVFDCTTRRRRTYHEKTPVSAPLAWSPDGKHIVGVGIKDPSRIILLSAANLAVQSVVAMHMGQITHVAFTPDGSSLVSVGKDGWIRVTSARSWKTLGRIEVETKYEPSLMALTPQSNAVVSVWGRDVRIWDLEKGTMTGYNLDSVRETEGWPLCISADCKYLACQTEKGFDISEVETGKVLGEVTERHSFITSAAFSPDSRWIVVGSFNGTVQLLDLLT